MEPFIFYILFIYLFIFTKVANNPGKPTVPYHLQRVFSFFIFPKASHCSHACPCSLLRFIAQTEAELFPWLSPVCCLVLCRDLVASGSRLCRGCCRHRRCWWEVLEDGPGAGGAHCQEWATQGGSFEFEGEKVVHKVMQDKEKEVVEGGGHIFNQTARNMTQAGACSVFVC